MPSVLTRAALLIALALPPAALALPAMAQTSIVAVVNGEPITSYDVAQRERLLRLTGGGGALKEKAIEELISEKIQIKAAKAAKIEAPDADVDRAVADIATRVKLSPAQLAQALGQAGVSIEALKDRLRAQIAFGRLVRAKFQQSGQVTEQDLVHALLKDDEREKIIDTFEYTLEQVIVALPKDPSPQRLAQAKSVAEGIRSKFTSCSQGLQMAKGTRNVVVRPFGRRSASELSPDARDAVKDVPVGRLAEPLPGARGLIMLAVCDKKAIRSVNAAMKELEPEMTQERGEQFTKQYLRQLRRDAVVERL